MLFLTFQIGKDRYALGTGQVIEVLPLVGFKTIPQAAAGVLGIFNYHGRPVPLIDLTKLTLGTPSEARMSTRIIVVKYARDSGETVVLGLKAEHATETIRRSDQDFVVSGIEGSGTFLGPVTMEADQIIQRVDITRLLPDHILDHLSREVAGHSE
jgi:chemotaxis-related protein WspB